MIGPLEFFVILAVLYLAECFQITHPDGVVLRRLRSGQFRQRHPVRYPGNGKWGWTLLNPLLPGAETFEAKPPSPRFQSPAAFDASAIRERISSVRRHAAGLRRNAVLAFGLLFAVFPAAVWGAGLSKAIWFCLPPLLGLAAWTATVYLGASKQIFPKLSAEDRYGQAAKFLLYPLSLTRAADSVVFDSLQGFDPIAVLRVTRGADAALPEAAREWAKLRFATRAEKAAELEVLTRALAQLGIPIESIAAPKPDSPRSQSYCPSCRSQYTRATGVCEDCEDTALQPFPAA
jgi:hypothetical protein